MSRPPPSNHQAERCRLGDTEALGEVDADFAQHRERIGMLDEFGDGLKPELLAIAVELQQFRQGFRIPVDVPYDASRELDDLRAGLLVAPGDHLDAGKIRDCDGAPLRLQAGDGLLRRFGNPCNLLSGRIELTPAWQ